MKTTGQLKERGEMKRDKLLLFFLGLLLFTNAFQPVSAFKGIDQAMCGYVDSKNPECNYRKSDFQPTDEWAFFWFRGTFETPDVGASWGFNIREPDGEQFLVGPFQDSLLGPTKPGEIVGWIGIGVSRPNMTWGLKPGLSICCPTTLDGRSVRAASEKPGEWRVEFRLNDKAVVSERFSILGATAIAAITPTEAGAMKTSAVTRTETQLATPALPLDFALAGAVLLVVVIVVAYVYVRRRRRPGGVQ